MTTPGDNLADHEKRSVQALIDVYQKHARRSSQGQRVIAKIVAEMARPWTIIFALMAVTAWIAVNLWLAHHHRWAPDPPPFSWLELATTVAGFALASLILGTQKRDDEIATQQSQLTLELALLNDHKTAKLIALIEELRRDSPGLVDRHDEQSDAMSKPADAGTILQVINRGSGIND